MLLKGSPRISNDLKPHTCFEDPKQLMILKAQWIPEKKICFRIWIKCYSLFCLEYEYSVSFWLIEICNQEQLFTLKYHHC